MNPAIKAFENYLRDSKAHPATSLEQKLTFEAYKFFNDKYFINFEMSVSEHNDHADPDAIEEGIKQLQEKIFTQLNLGIDPFLLVFPIMEFFYADYQGFTSTGKSDIEKTADALPFIQTLGALMKKTVAEYSTIAA